MKPSGCDVRLVVLSSDGQPVPETDLRDATVLDMDSMPAFRQSPETGSGTVSLPAPDGPFAVCLPLRVAGFGHVYVYADNAGAGYSANEAAGRTLNFAFEAAASRVAAVVQAEGSFRELGTCPSAGYSGRMARAQTLLADARGKRSDDAACAKLAMASLAESLHAGEMLVVEHARSRIAASAKRNGFLLGCNGFRYLELGERYAEAFSDLLNFVTLPFYRARTEAEEGARDFSRVDKILEWTTRDGLAVKGHPLVWFHRAGIPKWLEGRSYEEFEATHRDYVLDAVGRYRDRVKIWDIINEAHDWANDVGYSQEQLTEMTRLAADATREADSEAVRVVNSCWTWSEYVATGRNYSRAIGRPARSVLQYIRDLIDAGVEFEAVGLQMYYPTRDLFEIDRQLERFSQFGKAVHITELGVSSSVQPVKYDPIVDVHIKRYWHGHPWTETDQADWIEGYYTLCYSKPAVEAVTWWDFCDPSFIPHGGLVDENLRPKEGYHRLKRLAASWS